MTKIEESPDLPVGSGFAVEVPKRKLSSNLDPIGENTDAQEFQRKISTTYSREQPPDRKISTERKISTGRRSSRLYSIHSLELDIEQPQQINLEHLRKKCAANTEKSCWYVLCVKCRKKETGPGWEPGFWQSVCPYPFCPTYRHVARCFSILLVVLLIWSVLYGMIGEDAAPGGQLFNIALLVVAAHLGGFVFRMCNLPGLVAMLFVGMTFQNLGLVNINSYYQHICAILRKIALTIILTRAGLDLEPKAMKSLIWTIMKLGLLPWFVEASLILTLTHFLLGFPWMWSLLTGFVRRSELFHKYYKKYVKGLQGLADRMTGKSLCRAIIAAVAPAVVVSALMKLRGKGYGVAKGIPTLVIAISGMDDASSVAAFGIIQSLMFSENSLLYNIALGPISILGGIGFGLVWGLLSKYVPESRDPFVVPLRVLMLLGGGLFAVFGSESINLEGAGPLGVVAAAFTSMYFWCAQGWDIEDNPVATSFEIFWMLFEPILFSLTGTQIRINEIDSFIFKFAVAMIIFASVVRVLVTVLVGFGSILNLREKLFVAFSCMAKASVQAALAPVALDAVERLGRGDEDLQHARTMLVICVLSVMVTAPAGAITILLAGPHLLTKDMSSPAASSPPASSPRHRSLRPSLRDIRLVDNGKETHDLDRRRSYFERRKSSATFSQRSSVLSH